VTRDAAAIGAGLDPVREPRPIRAGERIHVVGAGGAGASAAALLAHAAGAVITACDAGGPSPYTAALEALGVTLAIGHDPSHVTAAPVPDRLAVTKALTAVDPDNVELRAAREAGIPVEPWQQVIADAATGRRLVAIAGTHGKSTTAGWLVHVLAAAGLDPSAFVGALLPPDLAAGTPATARIGKGAPFVVEADEYAGNFDAYRPAVAVLTSAEWDHPDVFVDGTAVEDAFLRWLEAMPAGGTVVANVADAGVAAIVNRLVGDRLVIIPVTISDEGPVPGSLVGRIVAEDPDGTTLVLDLPDSPTRPSPRSWSGCRPRGGTTRPMRSVSQVPPLRSAWPRPPSRAVSRRSAASVAAWSARAKRTASWCTTTTVIIRPPSGPRSRPSASGSPAAACGRSTSR
jgi:hypothetical protein